MFSNGAQIVTVVEEAQEYNPLRPIPTLSAVLRELSSPSSPSGTGIEVSRRAEFHRTADLVLWCPNTDTDYVWINTRTRRVWFESCARHGCLYCAPRQAVDKGWAVRLANPAWGVVITRPGTSHDQRTVRLRRFCTVARKLACGSFEMAWATERNPAGDGVHVHGWARSDTPDLALVVAEAGRRAGTGYAFAEHAWQPEGPFTYPMKTVVRLFGTSVREAEAIFDDYRLLNGTRLLHSTRNFWVDETGRSVGAKEAMRAGKRFRKGVPRRVVSLEHPPWHIRRVPVASLAELCERRPHDESNSESVVQRR